MCIQQRVGASGDRSGVAVPRRCGLVTVVVAHSRDACARRVSLLHVMQSVQRRNVSRAGLTITFYGGAPGEIGEPNLARMGRGTLTARLRDTLRPTGRFFEESCR